jgi:hypothetical protein
MLHKALAQMAFEDEDDDWRRNHKDSLQALVGGEAKTNKQTNKQPNKQNKQTTKQTNMSCNPYLNDSVLNRENAEHHQVIDKQRVHEVAIVVACQAALHIIHVLVLANNDQHVILVHAVPK